MLGAVAVASCAVWRRTPDVGELLRWLALVLAVANLVNKQAFYNQFWFVAALVPPPSPPTPSAPRPHAAPTPRVAPFRVTPKS